MKRSFFKGRRVLGALTLIGLALPLSAASEKPLNERSYKDILKNYYFVGDFAVQPETRELPAEEVFWRYPLPLPKASFPLIITKPDPSEFPATPGEGRAIEHLNRGRQLFLDGDYEEAKKTWLSARARFGKTSDHHRRVDYFIASAFLHLSLNSADDKQRQHYLNNASTFLSWAFQEKSGLPDPIVEKVTPKGLYNLAALYYNNGRFGGAYGAASEGLNFLRRTGRKDLLAEFHRILAESFVQNRTYLEAVQELDTALRQDPDKDQAADIFGRVGDIYFDVNNFELAEDAYALANRVSQETRRLRPEQLVLRGESLFWMGRYSDAQKMFYAALTLENVPYSAGPLDKTFAAVASIRTADAWLAKVRMREIQKKRDEVAKLREKAAEDRDVRPALAKAEKEFETLSHPLEQAKLGYFKHMTEYRGHPTETAARVRLACLELPEYDGNNVRHARELLSELKISQTTAPGNETAPPLGKELTHLAWACETASYAQHERTPEMVERVRQFAHLYPQSRFLGDLVEPVREVQAKNLDAYFAASDLHGATSFFEQTRKKLFPKVSVPLRRQLFEAYVDTHRSSKAAEFWDAYVQGRPLDTNQLLRAATVAAELATKTPKPWRARSREMGRRLAKTPPLQAPDPATQLYLNRILATPAAAEHIPWMIPAAQVWAQSDVRQQCEWVYPLLSRSFRSRPSPYPELAIRRATITLIDKHIGDIMVGEPTCAHGVLELEARLFRDNPAALAKRYLDRQSLPIDAVVANIVWSLSERLTQKRDHTTARALWVLLSEHGSPDLTEVRFAKARLDNRKTEFEQVWD